MSPIRSYSRCSPRNNGFKIRVLIAALAGGMGIQSALAAGPQAAPAGVSRPAAQPQASHSQVTPGTGFRAVNACTDLEKWGMGSARAVPKVWFDLFIKPIKNRDALIGEFNKAYVLKDRFKSNEAQALADYWMARSEYRMGLIHLAHQSFNRLMSSQDFPETLGIRIAALECLNRLQRDYPALSLSRESTDKMLAQNFAGVSPWQVAVIREAAFNIVKNQGFEDYSTGPGAQVFRLLDKGGQYEAYARALVSMKQGDYQTAAEQFKKYFSYGASPAPMKRYDFSAHMLLGRSYYEFGRYDAAIAEFKKITTDSNYFPQTLVDTAWAHLRKKNYNEAVGVAFSLQTGGMARTFTPEAPVIMAISLVELCHFPDALKQLTVFMKNYISAYKWLYLWNQNKAKGEKSLYQDVLDYTKKKTEIPSKVATEWFRSPVFLSGQKEINLIYDERGILQHLLAKINGMKPNPRNKNFAGVIALHEVVSRHIKDTDLLEKAVLDKINSELAAVNLRMLNDIASVAENAQLVEAEVYNLAGEDIIRKNARPDAFGAPKRLKDGSKSDQGPIWNWGNIPATADESAEVWEDELGLLKADLTDQCPKSAK